MEAFVSAVFGDLVSRFISSMIGRYREAHSVEEKLQKLQQLLLRVHTIVEEAEGRDITNERMLLQLEMLMEAMYRGYFMLDTFKYRALAEKAASDDEVRHSLALSDIMYPCKRHCFATSVVVGSEGVNELRSVLENLGSVIANAREFLLLLGGYPRMFRQPYSTYLFADTCIFGRQIERQRIINFLQEKDQNSTTQKLSVLPIIGLRAVGKKTLVEHACNDDRVLNYYPSILCITRNDLQKRILTKDKRIFPAVRCLLIVKFGSEVNKMAWERFYSFVCSMASAGSKIIITSRADEIANFGTTQPLRLKYLLPEEYWYFFKLLAFGSSNADEHPHLASLAMELAALFKGSFILAHNFGRMLRANFDSQFWCRVLESWKKSMQKNLLLFRDMPTDLVAKSHPFNFHQIGMHSKFYLLNNYFNSTDSLSVELPKVTMQDVVTGKKIPIEKEFQVLAWKSLLPLYHCYIGSCVKQESRGVVSKKKLDQRKSASNSQRC